MSNLPVKNIKPGELHVSDSPCRITTLLGSCVSVTVHNTRKKFGGMNHFMLPEVIESQRRGSEDFRFGDLSTRHLLDRMLEFDSNKNHLDVKIFGGGRVVESLSRARIGESNIEAAEAILDEYGLEPSKRYVEGENGLKLDFNTRDNVVRVKKIKKSRRKASDDTTETERERLKQNESKVAEILSPDDDTGGIDFLKYQ